MYVSISVIGYNIIYFYIISRQSLIPVLQIYVKLQAIAFVIQWKNIQQLFNKKFTEQSIPDTSHSSIENNTKDPINLPQGSKSN